jgi:putative ATPase
MLPPMVLWGPPGSGKTSLALLLGEAIGAVLERFNTTTGGVKEARALIAAAREREQRTLLFVDELHRFSRAQQDVFLPHVEAGKILMVGATTENPAFHVNAPLLSRLKVVVLTPLTPEQVTLLLRRALTASEGLGPAAIQCSDAALGLFAAAAEGDARFALNALELAAAMVGVGGALESEDAEQALAGRSLRHGVDVHYDLASALQKSIRGSDPQAATYWITRMLQAGDDPLFVARRLVRTASEDIGLADPQALTVALAARDAVHFLGMPEGALALVEAGVYLATAPKSNSVYKAHSRAVEMIERMGQLPVPAWMRNAPTKLARELGHGSGYRYDHDFPHAYAGQRFLPDEVQSERLYRPGGFAHEKEIARRMEWWEGLRREAR